MEQDVKKPKRVIRLPETELRTGLKKSTIYEFIANGSFPKPINLGSRAVGWLEEEIDQWLDTKIQQSRNSVQI
jgi:prophage regulatory protein